MQQYDCAWKRLIVRQMTQKHVSIHLQISTTMHDPVPEAAVPLLVNWICIVRQVTQKHSTSLLGMHEVVTAPPASNPSDLLQPTLEFPCAWHRPAFSTHHQPLHV